MAIFSGRCLCGGVAFEAAGDSLEADACHCAQCRRWSGHYWASVNAPLASFKVTSGAEKIRWHRSSDAVRRGFCESCGSALFWHPDRNSEHAHMISISAGSLDPPTQLKLTKHIFVRSKGDYYAIADGLPQKEEF